MKKIIKKILLRIRGEIPLEKLKSRGMKVGTDFWYGDNCTFDVSHCWLISIGNNVTFSSRVHLLAHDASLKKMTGYAKIGLINIGITGSKSGGLVGDYQAAGMMMSISCILFMIDYFNDKDEKKNLVGILLSVSGLFISGKRMFSLIAIFAFVLIYLLSERENRKVRFWGALILLIIGAAILYAAMPSARELFLRITELSGNETNMTSGRNVLWEKAIEIFNEHKLYGIGFGGFQTYYENHYNIPGIQAFLTHNIYYGLLSETGIIGFGIYVSLIVYMLCKSFRLRKKVQSINKYNVTYIYTYSILMQLWFILYGFTGNGIYDANETFFYFSAVAMMLSINQYCSKYK
ncbi:MAG: O-antigen ligase family protein [Marvinbryantia sp.]|uniref:O-antigen ligase family protein n=1 Tax=Marvinbryantia sp. TaxID=2496532 RepID=UPI00399B0FF4